MSELRHAAVGLLALVSLAGAVTWGYIDKTGAWAIPPQFEAAGGFDSAGRARVGLKGRFGQIDRTARLRTDTAYLGDVSNFSEGLACVKVRWNGQFGWMDTMGKMVIAAVYNQGTDFLCGRAWVKGGANSQWSAIDRRGIEAIQDRFDAVDGFYEGRARFANTVVLFDEEDEEPSGVEARFGFVDTFGNDISSDRYEAAGNFSEGRAAIRLQDKFGFISLSGVQVIPCGYDGVLGFSEGLAVVQRNGKFGCVDPVGTLVIPMEFGEIRQFREGLAPAEKDDRWGYIDQTGKFAVAPQFIDAQPFSEGLAPVRTGARWGYIDKTGKLAIPAEFESVSDFSQGLAAAARE